MIRLTGTMAHCGQAGPHEPHSMSTEEVPLYGTLHRICVGTRFMADLIWREHPAGGLFAFGPAVDSAPVTVAYVPADDVQDMLGSWFEEQREQAAALDLAAQEAEAVAEADQAENGPISKEGQLP
jgi:hypothetical protein